MKEEIKSAIQEYLEAYYRKDFEKQISFLDESETVKYVQEFTGFAEQMDRFGETEDLLHKIGVKDVKALKGLTTEEFMIKMLGLSKREIGDDEINKIVGGIQIDNIDIIGSVATVDYSYPVTYFDEEHTLTSTIKLTNQNEQWKIHFQSRLDTILSSFQLELDTYEERKRKDQLQNLNHHVNDLEKVTVIGYKNMNGDIVFEPRFKDGGDFSDGMAYVQVMTKYGYIDSSGDLVVKPRFVGAKDFSEDRAGIQLQGSDQWGFIDKKGRIMIEPKFDDVTIFSEGLCAVEMDGKWGFIDIKGDIVIACQYEEVNDFWSDETQVVLLDEKGESNEFYINKKGEVV